MSAAPALLVVLLVGVLALVAMVGFVAATIRRDSRRNHAWISAHYAATAAERDDAARAGEVAA